MLRSMTCARRRLTPSRTPRVTSTSALRSAGTNRQSSVSTAIPMSTCGCRVRTSLSPSNQALIAGTAFAAAQIARTRRTVTSLPGAQAWMSASSLSVVATTWACASAMTRAMLRRTPLSCSGWPVADTEGGCVRIGLPEADSWVRCAASRAGAGAAAGLAAAAAGAAPALAVPSAAACFTSAMVMTAAGSRVGGFGRADCRAAVRARAGGAVAGGGGFGDLAALVGGDDLVAVVGCGASRAARRCGRRGARGRTVVMAGVLALGALRGVGVEFELGQHRAGHDHVAGAAGKLEHLARDRRGHVDDGLGGLHRDQVVVEADGVAFLHVPLDDGRVREAFAEVGEQELLGRHVPFFRRTGLGPPCLVRDVA